MASGSEGMAFPHVMWVELLPEPHIGQAREAAAAVKLAVPSVWGMMVVVVKSPPTQQGTQGSCLCCPVTEISPADLTWPFLHPRCFKDKSTEDIALHLVLFGLL